MRKTIDDILRKGAYVGATVSTIGIIIAGAGVGTNNSSIQNVGIFTTCLGMGILNTAKIGARFLKAPLDDLESQISNTPPNIPTEPIHDNLISPQQLVLNLHNGDTIEVRPSPTLIAARLEHRLSLEDRSTIV